MFFSAEELFKRAGAGGGGGGREVVEEDWMGIGKEYEGGANVTLELGCAGIVLLILMLLLLLLAPIVTGTLFRNNVPALILFFSSEKN